MGSVSSLGLSKATYEGSSHPVVKVGPDLRLILIQSVYFDPTKGFAVKNYIVVSNLVYNSIHDYNNIPFGVQNCMIVYIERMLVF